MERILEHWRDLDYREPTLKIICPHDYSKKRFGLFVDGCPNLLWELMRTRREQLTASQLMRKNPTEAHRDKLHRLSPDTEALRMLKLGFRVSEPTVSRWLRQAPRNPDSTQRRLTFLRNHRDAIAAMDFFLVPTFTFGVLYCFFVMGHDRRRILRFNVTRNSNALWIV